MEGDEVSERADEAATRLGRLWDRARLISGDDASKELLEDTLAELSDAIDELHTATEELARHNAALAKSTAEYVGLFDLAPDAYLVTTAEGVIRDVNREALNLLGGTDGGLRDVPLTSFVSLDDHERYHSFIERMGADRPSTLELRLRRQDGVEIHATVRAVAAEDRVGRRILRWLVRDDTERRTIEARLAHEATHDFMTGVPNRVAFMAMLEAALLQRPPGQLVGVLFIDLDGFKLINDEFGHDTGDELLRAAVSRVRRGLRDDDLLGRLGGDEFAAACIIEHPDEAVHLAERVRREVGDAYAIGRHTIRITASIGVTIADDDADDASASALIGEADSAMYRAKRHSKDRVEVFGGVPLSRHAVRHELDARLHRAMEQGELCVWYQPTISLDDGRVTAVEALLRWDVPGRGMLSAREFLDMAEDDGLIVPIGRWVLAEASRHLGEWRRDFPASDLVLSVNVTPFELAQANVADAVERTLGATGSDPSWLCLELAEQSAGRVAERGDLDALRQLGVRFGVDGFGAGAAGIAHLREGSVDVLKLDGSLVEDLERNPVDQVIVGALARLGSELGITVVGVGVERASQAAVLTDLGFRHAQGFFLARPQPAEGVTELLARGPHP